MKPQLSTPRIRLRAPEPEDVDRLLQLENEADEQEAVPSATGPYSRYQFEQYICQNTNDLFADRELRLLIDYRGHDSMAGIIDVFNFDPRHRRAEVGILLTRPYRGIGLASEALQLVVRHCLDWLGLHQLYAYVRTDNAPCLRLFEHCGFVCTGRLNDWLFTGHGYQDVCLLQCTTSLPSAPCR